MKKLKIKIFNLIYIFRNYSSDEKIAFITLILLFAPMYVAAVPVVLAAFQVISDTLKRRAVLNTPLSGLILSLLIVFCIGAAFTQNWTGMLFGIMIWMSLIYALYLTAFMNARFFRHLMMTMISLSFVSAFIAAVQFVFNPAHARVSSTFSNPNYYAFMIEILIIISFYYLFTEKRNRFFLISAIFINSLALVLTNCRTAILGLIAGVFVLMLLTRKYKILIAGTALGLIGLGCILLFPQFFPRFDLLSLLRSADQRELIWEVSLRAAMESPLIGHGVYGYAGIWDMYDEGFKTVHAHNIFINSFLDVGIIGSIIWIIYAVMIPVRAFKRRFENDGGGRFAMIVSVMAVCLVHGLTDVPMMGVQTMIVLFFVASFMGINRKKEVLN